MRRALAPVLALALLATACQSDAGKVSDVAGQTVPGESLGDGVTSGTPDGAATAAPTAVPSDGASPGGTPAFAPTPTAPVRGDTRELPLAIGRSRLVGTEWEVEVVGYDPDATDEVVAFNAGNEPPPPGEVYAVARIRATYVGPDASANAFLNLEWALVDDAGELHTDADCQVLPDDLASQSGVPPQGTAEGTICFSAPQDVLDQVVLHLAPLLGDSSTRIWWVAPKEGVGRVL